MGAITQSIGGGRSVRVPPSPLSAEPSLLRALEERQRQPISLSLSHKTEETLKKQELVEKTLKMKHV